MASSAVFLGDIRDIDISFRPQRAAEQTLRVLFEKEAYPDFFRVQGDIDQGVGFLVEGSGFVYALLPHGQNSYLLIVIKLQTGEDSGMQFKGGYGITLVYGGVQIVRVGPGLYQFFPLH